MDVPVNSPCFTCVINSVSALASPCDPVNSQYSVSGQIDFSNPPSSGTLTVTNSCGGSQTFNAPFNSPLNYNIPNLNASGGSCTVTATFFKIQLVPLLKHIQLQQFVVLQILLQLLLWIMIQMRV